MQTKKMNGSTNKQSQTWSCQW